jgi:hypothetical protein
VLSDTQSFFGEFGPLAIPLAVVRHCLDRFYTTLKNLASLHWIVKLFEGLTIVVKTFRIVGSTVDKSRQRVSGFGKHFGLEVSYANFAPNFTPRVLVVLTQNVSEMVDGVLQASLLASYPTKLKMRVRFIFVDGHGLSETFDRFGILPARVKHQPQLIVSARISRIDGGRFHGTFKTLSLPQRKTDVPDVAAKHHVSVEKQKW